MNPITEHRSPAAKEFNRLQWRFLAALSSSENQRTRVAAWIAAHPYTPPYTRPESRITP